MKEKAQGSAAADRVALPGLPRLELADAALAAHALAAHAHGPGRGSSRSGAAPDGAPVLDRANFTGLVLGCVEAKFCKNICV